MFSMLCCAAFSVQHRCWFNFTSIITCAGKSTQPPPPQRPSSLNTASVLLLEMSWHFRFRYNSQSVLKTKLGLKKHTLFSRFLFPSEQLYKWNKLFKNPLKYTIKTFTFDSLNTLMVSKLVNWQYSWKVGQLILITYGYLYQLVFSSCKKICRRQKSMPRYHFAWLHLFHITLKHLARQLCS